MNTLLTTLRRARATGLVDKPWVNALGFQITWFVCVLGGDTYVPIALALIGLHFLLVGSPRQEVAKLAPIVALGLSVDALLSAAGVFDFGDTWVPLWLCLLWVAFATTLERAFAFLGRSPWLAAVVGGIGVPFNYAAGANLGAVNMPLDPWLTALVLISLWALLLPALFRLAAADAQHRCV